MRRVLKHRLWRGNRALLRLVLLLPLALALTTRAQAAAGTFEADDGLPPVVEDTMRAEDLRPNLVRNWHNCFRFV